MISSLSWNWFSVAFGMASASPTKTFMLGTTSCSPCALPPQPPQILVSLHFPAFAHTVLVVQIPFLPLPNRKCLHSQHQFKQSLLWTLLDASSSSYSGVPMVIYYKFICIYIFYFPLSFLSLKCLPWMGSQYTFKEGEKKGDWAGRKSERQEETPGFSDKMKENGNSGWIFQLFFILMILKDPMF